MKRAVFAMVTTRSSARYTPVALASFFAHTPLHEEDRFILIDNDGHYSRSGGTIPARVELAEPAMPRSFAGNANTAMEIARAGTCDLYFLNNDLVFSEGWLAPLASDAPAILCPLSNREVHHSLDGFECKTTLDLEEYLGREHLFTRIAENHRRTLGGYHMVMSMPFYCVKLPYTVYSEVGPFDESFGRGGAEDDDYSIRAYLAGFSVHFACGSYVLHFNGKSTWAGAETASETDDRVRKFREVFTAKWGARMCDLLIGLDQSALSEITNPATLTSAAKIREALDLVRRCPIRGIRG